MEPVPVTLNLILLHELQKLNRGHASQCQICGGKNPNCILTQDQTDLDGGVSFKIEQMKLASISCLTKLVESLTNEAQRFCYEDLVLKEVTDFWEAIYRNRSEEKYLCSDLESGLQQLQTKLDQVIATIEAFHSKQQSGRLKG